MNPKKSDVTPVGLFLRRLRFEHNESQEEMAQKLGITAPYISLLEYRQPLTKKLALGIIRSYNLSGKEKDAFVNMVTNDVVQRFWGKVG
ncbi:MAG: helix-turn-helix domain-containing protein [Treponema sp.]|nr:helix-turn-helix domain-containing protein [Treponema sp.]